jgi:endonuclease YncB( thermonuclease family)
VEDNTPRDGWTTEVDVVRIIDGDTMEVEIRRRFRVRLSHPHKYKTYIFDTPEKNTKLGKRALRCVKDLLNRFNGIVRVFVPARKTIELLDSSSLGRFNGEIWLDDQRLSGILLEKGLARMISRRKRKKTPWE